MIQRIQTIFLLLVVASFGGMFSLPMAISDKATAQFFADKIYTIHDHPALLTLTLLGMAIALISIFVYRNRKVQLKLGYGVMVLAILLPLISFLLFTNESPNMDSGILVKDQIGMFLPIVAFVFSAVANYFIRKDDRLVKSMDRLR